MREEPLLSPISDPQKIAGTCSKPASPLRITPQTVNCKKASQWTTHHLFHTRRQLCRLLAVLSCGFHELQIKSLGLHGELRNGATQAPPNPCSMGRHHRQNPFDFVSDGRCEALDINYGGKCYSPQHSPDEQRIISPAPKSIAAHLQSSCALVQGLSGPKTQAHQPSTLGSPDRRQPRQQLAQGQGSAAGRDLRSGNFLFGFLDEMPPSES